MSLFQKSVTNKYLKNLDTKKVDKAFENFQKFYGNKLRLANIMQLKEENYQEGFLREIFVETLGYIINPDENFNLTTEFKNQKDARKADGAILKDGKAIGVIELKSTKTKNLESIKEQAFGYKNNQPDCKYVITSNFQSLRFYVDNATEYEEFNLFQLNKEQFKLLYLLLSQESIFSGLPEKLKQETKFHENEISTQLYADYKHFKDKIFENLVKNNPKYDKLTLFKKSQKLLDRFLFVFFAEDSGLIPPNAVSKIVEQWKDLKELDEYKPLYSRFQKIFTHLDKGHVYKKWGEIPAYNGGLFRNDEILDRSDVRIDDEILEKDSLKLSKYDFNTEVDVNILGHIFEHSLNEIEEITAELHGGKIDKKKSKRKKDGVFYTPKYITKYIVENTVGTLCNEKKEELQINNLLIDENYRKKDGKLNETGKKLFKTLNSYKGWLLTLKILDPACGSGAFLNQTLDFLIAEHKQADDLLLELTGDKLGLFDTDKSILENKIYGVDINEESVEIAKLSLWLRTAQKGRPLSDLNNNIKCGNSLIDDPEAAGGKAFNWNVEFKEIMDNGGFDVVIGNPPYVDIKGLEPNLVKALFNKYKTSENRINLYSIFIEKAYYLVKDKGFVSFINPNSILVNSSYTKIRKLLINDISKIVKLPDNVFPDAKVETIVFEFRKNSKYKNADIIVYFKSEIINFVDNSLIKIIDKTIWENTTNKNYNIFVSNADIKLLHKIKTKSTILTDLADFSLGITPYDKYKGHSQELIKSRQYHSTTKIDDNYKPLITGENITRYSVTTSIKEHINYGNWLGAKREERFFTEPRVIVRQIVSGKPPRIYAGYTEENLYFTQIGFSIIPKTKNGIKAKYLAILLNSQLITYYHKYKYLDLEKNLFQKILIANCKQFPIKNTENQQPFIEKADLMLSLNKELQKEKDNFLNTIKEEKGIEKIIKKLDTFFNFEYDILKKELSKQKVKFALGNENNEWREYFNSSKQKINELQTQISQTDNQIDKMVYELYELTEEEIETIEKSK